MSDERTHVTVGGCCSCSFVLFNLILGGWSAWYLALTFLHQHIAWYWAVLIGLIGGEVTVPVAIVIFILKHAHII